MKDDIDTSGQNEEEKEKTSNEDDLQLKNAATIGTALMLVNSHRALFLMYVHKAPYRSTCSIDSHFSLGVVFSLLLFSQ